MNGDGTCGFCGRGDGHLGEQGDERSEYLEALARTGVPGEWVYEPLAVMADSNGQILWCGTCLRGLAHRFQRFDDRNLFARQASYELYLTIDPVRWSSSRPTPASEHRLVPDDFAVHVQKVSMSDEVALIAAELTRRRGQEPQGWHE